MAIIKSYTDIEQSKKLAEILPLESADMYYFVADSLEKQEVNYAIRCGAPIVKTDIPCWSLAALLELLELPTLEKNGIGKGKTGWMVTHYDVSGMRYDTTYHDNPIDACVSMIELLHEQKLL